MRPGGTGFVRGDLAPGQWRASGLSRQVRPAQASSTRARGARKQPGGGGRETGVVHRGALLRASRREPTEAALRSPSPTDKPLGSGGCWVLPLPQVQAEPPESWPALPAAPKTPASSEAGMAGRGGRRRRRMPLRRRRG